MNRPPQLRAIAQFLVFVTLGAGCNSGDSRAPDAISQKATDAPTAKVDPIQEAASRLIAGLVEEPENEGTKSALVALGKPVVPNLEQALAHSDPEFRTAIVEVLVQIPGDEAFGLLRRALSDENEEVRFAVAEALGVRADTRAVPDLVARYEIEDDGPVRYEILTSLGPIGDPSTIPMLVKESSHEDPYVRMWSADALCKMGAAESVEVATRLIGDSNQYVRRRVLGACAGALVRPDAQAGVLQIALTADNFEESVTARRNLQKWLSNPGSRELRNRIETTALAALEGDHAIQAALVLADISNAAGLEVLRNGVGNGDPFVRHHIAFELGRLGGPSSVAPLVGLLEDPSDLVAATAYDALLNFADKGNEEAIRATAAYTGEKFPQRLKDLAQAQG